MRLNNGKCVDGDDKCVGPVYPLEDFEWDEYDDYYRCSECNAALQDAEDQKNDERTFW